MEKAYPGHEGVTISVKFWIGVGRFGSLNADTIARKRSPSLHFLFTPGQRNGGPAQ
jgi:hypothetical protein